MNEVEFVPRHREKVCYCNGKNKNCKLCRGAGKFRDTFYILVVNGFAYGVDTLK